MAPPRKKKESYAGTAVHRGDRITDWRTADGARRDNGMMACSREIEEDEVGAIETLADLNRANRAKFAQRSVGDHDLGSQASAHPARHQHS